MRLLLFLIFSSLALGHGGVKHEEVDTPKSIKSSSAPNYKKIKSTYIEKVKPIFKKSCFDCHSNQVEYPWYYNIPVIKQMIDSDIAEAKTHLDFSNDYPFKSHETPLKDLESIKQVVISGDMPPIEYNLLHPSKKLSDKEKSRVIDWVNKSMEILKNE